MFHIVMAKASIRQLRTEFPKVRAMIEREGEVVVTERGQAGLRHEFLPLPTAAKAEAEESRLLRPAAELHAQADIGRSLQVAR